jgi:hypothetical protein
MFNIVFFIYSTMTAMMLCNTTKHCILLKGETYTTLRVKLQDFKKSFKFSFQIRTLNSMRNYACSDIIVYLLHIFSEKISFNLMVLQC